MLCRTASSISVLKFMKYTPKHTWHAFVGPLCVLFRPNVCKMELRSQNSFMGTTCIYSFEHGSEIPAGYSMQALGESHWINSDQIAQTFLQPVWVSHFASCPLSVLENQFRAICLIIMIAIIIIIIIIDWLVTNTKFFPKQTTLIFIPALFWKASRIFCHPGL